MNMEENTLNNSALKELRNLTQSLIRAAEDALSFPTCRHILTCYQQTTFQILVAKVEIAYHEQFLNMLLNSFQ